VCVGGCGGGVGVFSGAPGLGRLTRLLCGGVCVRVGCVCARCRGVGVVVAGGLGCGCVLSVA